jgi:hypothetical protein
MEVTMKTRLRTLGIAALCLAGAACGASQGGSSTANAARSSVYTCPLDQILDASAQAVEAQFQKVASKDKEQAAVIGEPHWYAPADGALRGDAKIQPTKGDIALAIRVRIIDLRPNFQIQIDAYVREFDGTPEPRDLPEGDPRRPAWVQESIDKLAVDINSRLSSCSELVRDKS